MPCLCVAAIKGSQLTCAILLFSDKTARGSGINDLTERHKEGLLIRTLGMVPGHIQGKVQPSSTDKTLQLTHLHDRNYTEYQNLEVTGPPPLLHTNVYDVNFF